MVRSEHAYRGTGQQIRGISLDHEIIMSPPQQDRAERAIFVFQRTHISYRELVRLKTEINRKSVSN